MAPSAVGVRVWLKQPNISSMAAPWVQGVVKRHDGEELVVATEDGVELRVSAAEAPLHNAETVDVSVLASAAPSPPPARAPAWSGTRCCRRASRSCWQHGGGPLCGACSCVRSGSRPGCAAQRGPALWRW